MRLHIALLLLGSALHSQTYKDVKATTDERVEDLLSRMTTEEKIDYIGGHKNFYIRGIERLGLPEIKMTDGPVGTRNYGKTTAYPASVLAAASWDCDLAFQYGEALGKDARARGVHILLAPGVNISRAPMNGRNFEYLGEDPFLAGKMAVQYIKGVQSQGVVATVKHFALNNQEWDRNNVSSDVDERSLHELYLPAFKMAVQEGGVGAVMNSYNLVDGVHATQNSHLNLDILKNGWKFDGILMSDWDATYDGVAAANAGLDLEMPWGKFMNRKTLLPALENGRLKMETLDEHVRRILRVIFRFGFYDTSYVVATEPKEDPQNARVALEIARGGMVLLKNEGILPLKESVRSIALIGPNANSNVAGGGSSYTQPYQYVSLYDGIRQAVPSAAVRLLETALPTMEDYVQDSPFYTSKGSVERGLVAEYFDNQSMKGTPVATVVETNPNHYWTENPPVAGIPADHFSIRYRGVVRAPKTGTYTFAVRGDDGYRLYVDGEKVLDEWGDHGSLLRMKDMILEAGTDHELRLEYYENGGNANIAFAVYEQDVNFTEAVEAAKGAEVAIVSVGFNSDSESEGFDRSFVLPAYQAELIKAVSQANPNTVVLLNSGGNVYMQDWLPQVKGLLHLWYAGEQAGTAAADILFGRVNPSGKLPVSFEKEWKDNPTSDSYYDTDHDNHVTYSEGLSVGYRYYDKSEVKPQFAFGYGLSYTKFEYSRLRIDNRSRGSVLVSYTVRNVGDYDGAEVSQVYVSEKNPKVERPVKELKGFTKVFLKKGAKKTVTVKLDADAFSYYRVNEKAFGYEPGEFEILVGASSDDIRLRETTLVR